MLVEDSALTAKLKQFSKMLNLFPHSFVGAQDGAFVYIRVQIDRQSMRLMW